MSFMQSYVTFNSSFGLNEQISDTKVVEKKLRSLPKRFIPKVTTIEEYKDVDSLRVDELVGSLQTYKSTLPQPKKKNSSLRFSKKDNMVAIESFDADSSNSEVMSLLTRKFPRYFKTSKGSGRTFSADSSKSDSRRATRDKSFRPRTANRWLFQNF